MITIDGSFGEGGGQVIRTSLTLSLVTGKPFAITNIRAGRKQPGLLRQHLTAVNAAAEMSDAEVEGNRLRSPGLTFTPGQIRAGSYQFDIGSAGSTMLVFQTVLPALMCRGDRSELVLYGGTHNPHAPPFEFLRDAFLTLLNRMGPNVNLELIRAGFFPVGGGSVRVTINPADNLNGLELVERGAVQRQAAVALVANLPKAIADREVKVVRNALRLRKSAAKAVEMEDVSGPGNVMFVTVESEHVTEVFVGFGQQGLRAEIVAKRTVQQVQEYLASDGAVGRHLADQLLLPLAMAGSGRFTTLPPTDHTTTNIEVIKKFLDVEIHVERTDDPRKVLVVVEGGGG